MNKKERRTKRKELLARVDRMKPKLCKRCRAKDSSSKCKCNAAKALRSIGNELMSLVPPRMDAETGLRVKDPFDGLTLHTLTPDIYLDLKDDGMSDKEIIRLLKCRSNSLPEWKRENGVSKGGI